jgi:hypothetical protein
MTGAFLPYQDFYVEISIVGGKGGTSEKILDYLVTIGK